MIVTGGLGSPRSGNLVTFGYGRELSNEVVIALVTSALVAMRGRGVVSVMAANAAIQALACLTELANATTISDLIEVDTDTNKLTQVAESTMTTDSTLVVTGAHSTVEVLDSTTATTAKHVTGAAPQATNHDTETELEP